MIVLTTLSATVLAQEVTLTIQGAVIMVLCVSLVLGLTIFCMSRILGEQRPQEHHHAPLDIDTHDTQE
jgi:heme/copper-type cytochrome/quinol oxidase subunit 2